MSSVSGVSIPNVFQSATSGIQRGLSNLASDARKVAGSLPDGDMLAAVTSALVDTQGQKLATQASAKVVSAADQALGTLVDVIA
ncbi:MAG: hypothetical protein QM718_08755 [Steroidobacteraceae bacterium]